MTDLQVVMFYAWLVSLPPMPLEQFLTTTAPPFPWDLTDADHARLRGLVWAEADRRYLRASDLAAWSDLETRTSSA